MFLVRCDHFFCVLDDALQDMFWEFVRKGHTVYMHQSSLTSGLPNVSWGNAITCEMRLVRTVYKCIGVVSDCDSVVVGTCRDASIPIIP